MKKFNIRVYGIVRNEKNEVLLSDETYKDALFTKFPGGGLEWGEGTKETLRREFEEEFNLSVTIGELIYVNDFFQLSLFNENDQLISFYYEVILPLEADLNTIQGDKAECLRWKAIEILTEDDLTFPVDKMLVGELKRKRVDF